MLASTGRRIFIKLTILLFHMLSEYDASTITMARAVKNCAGPEMISLVIILAVQLGIKSASEDGQENIAL